jgi:hypothetical protein
MASLLPLQPTLLPVSTWPRGPSLPQAASDPRRSSADLVPAPSPSAAFPAPTTAAAISQCVSSTPHLAHPARTISLSMNAQIRSHDLPVPSHINPLPTPPASSIQYTPAQMVLPSRNFLPPRQPQVSAPPSDSQLQYVDDGESTTASAPATGGRSREKRHACWMCHKAFDRPSTLRKVPQLFLPNFYPVLTRMFHSTCWSIPARKARRVSCHVNGELADLHAAVAFACETCGRRFGVLSNLNRHVRRCALRADNTAAEGTSSSSDTSDAVVGSPEYQPHDALSPSTVRGDSEPVAEVPTTVSLGGASAPAPTAPPRRGRAATATIDAAGSGGISRKRRSRRAPSPSQWVPASLQAFDLTLTKDACLLPLAPVLPYKSGAFWEERDSYEGDTAEHPYHPLGWRGKLPGPGLRDMINNGMSSMGRLVFF